MPPLQNSAKLSPTRKQLSQPPRYASSIAKWAQPDSTLGSSRVEARVRAGQQLPSYPHFRASWQNGRQTLRLVSSTPSKIPYGGFSPVRLQARFRNRALHTVSCALTRPLFGFHNSVLGTSPWLGLSPNRRTSRFLSTTSPAVLGSLSGCSVRKGLRLL